MALARAADRIVVVPAGGAVRWEIEFLQQNDMIGRAVFLMPPDPETRPTLKAAFTPAARRESKTASSWQESRGEMRELGLELPEYRKDGMLFTLDENGKPDRQAVLKTKNPRVIRKGLKWLTGSQHI